MAQEGAAELIFRGRRERKKRHSRRGGGARSYRAEHGPKPKHGPKYRRARVFGGSEHLRGLSCGEREWRVNTTTRRLQWTPARRLELI